MTHRLGRTLVTGGSGFVGGAVLARLSHEGVQSLAVGRSALAVLPLMEPVGWGGLETEFDLTPALKGCDAVVHAAARVHVMRESARDSLARFRRSNVDGTMRLARQAVAAGVRRFVFLSSIKVNGEETRAGRPFTASDPAAPADPYGQSKYEAEEALRTLVASNPGDMDVVMIRPVLVYGPGVRANFLAMMRWIHRGVPLPLRAVHNRRSLVAIPNLVDLIVTALRHDRAANQTFLVSDGEDLSTPDLLLRTGKALGRPARLLPFPESALAVMARAIGRGETARRLLGSLQVDTTKTRELLDWRPEVSVDDALALTARWFLEHQRRRA